VFVRNHLCKKKRENGSQRRSYLRGGAYFRGGSLFERRELILEVGAYLRGGGLF
jgi:hypothetical protein